MKFRDCFTVDRHRYNQISKKWLIRLYRLYFTQRYSMVVYLRLTEYFYSLYKEKNNKLYLIFSNYFKRKNEVVNQFEHGYQHKISHGTLFHHTGVTLNDHVTIEKNVQIFKHVTLALVKGQTCVIGADSVIFSNVVILGKKIGKNCVIGAGSVVTKNIPDNSVVIGNPAKVIKNCKNAHDYLEYK